MCVLTRQPSPPLTIRRRHGSEFETSRAIRHGKPEAEKPPRMAIFHLTAKVISRGKGQSAIAAAAYRSGERLRDEQADEQKFYQTRAERIVFTDIHGAEGRAGMGAGP